MPTRRGGAVLRISDVIAKTGLSRSTIYSKMDAKSKAYDPIFPRQVRLSSRAVGWLESEVDDWLDQQASRRH
nr:AlpA family phage regulatory protein [uncultured Halomonas sp.]